MIPNLKAKLDQMRKDRPQAEKPAAKATAPECRRIVTDYAFGKDISFRKAWEDLDGISLGRVLREKLPEDIGYGDLLFMDTETTGLSTGAGTVAFLIGTAYFVPEGLRVEQFFLEDLHQEEDALKAWAERASSFRSVVTYNGKNYDLPLLESRALMNRMRPVVPEVSMDLLYPARRYFRGRFPSCSLSVLEDAVLGISRSENDDIPGAMIPAAYFRFLEDRDETRIRLILSHNRQDLVSLAELTLKLANMQKYAETLEDPEYLRICAGNAEAAGDRETAERLLRKAAPELSQASEDLIWLCKRQERWGDAYAACLAWTEAHRGGLEILELQAKLEEHFLRDPEKALATCRRAMTVLPRNGSKDLWKEWDHRRRRLLFKTGRKETV